MMAAVYLLCGVPGAYSLWYRRLYSACKNDSALSYLWFFVVYLGHIAFCLYAFIGGRRSIPVGVSARPRRWRSQAPLAGCTRWHRALRRGHGVERLRVADGVREVPGVGAIRTRGTRRCVRAFAPAPPRVEGRENNGRRRAARGTAIIDSIVTLVYEVLIRSRDRRDATRPNARRLFARRVTVSRSLPRSLAAAARSTREQISVPLVVVVLPGVFVHIRRA